MHHKPFLSCLRGRLCGLFCIGFSGAVPGVVAAMIQYLKLGGNTADE